MTDPTADPAASAPLPEPDAARFDIRQATGVEQFLGSALTVLPFLIVASIFVLFGDEADTDDGSTSLLVVGLFALFLGGVRLGADFTKRDRGLARPAPSPD